jgi:hypothetical protein
MTPAPPLLPLESPEIRALISALVAKKPPRRITQEPLDRDPSHYARLCDRAQPASLSDLCDYADDLSCGVPIQVELLTFLLPICLHAWQQSLSAVDGRFDTYIERFDGALARNAGFRELLKPRKYSAVGQFVCEAILQRISLETHLRFDCPQDAPYQWIAALATVGTAFPIVGDLWSRWWACSNEGHARGVLQYLSLLMYPDDGHPVFVRSPPQPGANPPLPWEPRGFVFDRCWLPENINFLRTTLTPEYAQQSLLTACARLEGKDNSGNAQRMLADLEVARPRLELRIEELLYRLSRPLRESVDWVTE